MKTAYLVLGIDKVTDRIRREYDISQDTFWRLRGLHFPREKDDGSGGIALDDHDVAAIVPSNEIAMFSWMVDTMEDYFDGDV